MKKIFIPLCASLFCWLPSLQAQQLYSPNTQHFILQQNEARAHRGTSTVLPLLEAYLSVDPDQAELEKLEALGIHINLDLGDLITVQLPADALQQLDTFPWVKYVQLATTPQPMMDKARAVSSVDWVHEGKGLNHGFTGKDVVIGIIDAGFDYTHPNFYTADGQTLRVKRVWEQSNTKGNAPEGFSYGAEYSTPEAILEASYDVSSNSHGTHVAGIAAGGYRGNNWYGVAGEADLVLVSKGELTPNNVNISDAIAYIYRYAESVGKPCVINMSLGMEIGPHDGTSLFDQVADRLQGSGKLLVGSSGNFRGFPIHVSQRFQGAEDAPMKTMVNFKSKPTTKKFGGEIDIWGEKGMKYEVQVVMNYYTKDEVVCASEVMDASNPEGGNQTFEITKNGTGKVLITTEINPQNQKPHTLISLQVTNLRSRNALGIIITPKTQGEVHAWADNIYVDLTDNDCKGWTHGDSEYTLAEIGGTGKRIISVGAYTTRNTYTPMGSTTEEQLNETVGDIASFSSTGPALDGRMKPEITAPGAFIISSVNSHDGTLGSLPLAGGIEGTNYVYGYMQGTSMAAPFVTGTVATWLEAYPELTPEDLREVMKATAQQDDFTRKDTLTPQGTWGYGKIDAYEGIKAVLAKTGITPIANDRQWVMLNGSSVVFCHSSKEVNLSVYDLTGQCVQSLNINPVVPGMEYRLESDTWTPGIYLLKVKSQQQQTSFKLIK